MRILGDTRLYPPTCYAGAELALHGILRDLRRRGHDCSVIVRDGQDATEHSIDVYSVQAERDDETILGLYEEADIVLSHMEAGIYAQALSVRSGTPLALLVHNETQLTWSAGLYASLVIPNSYQLDQKTAHQHHGIPSLVVHPPVYRGDVVLPEGVSPVEDTWESGFSAVQVGLSEEKGGHLFWRLAQREVERTFLAIQGGYGEQILRGADNTTVHAHVPHARMGNAYAQSRLLLVPCPETWGRVAVEALANGLPVIAHPSDGIMEALGGGKAGAAWFAYGGDPAAWSDALRALDDPEVYDAASTAAVLRFNELQDVQSDQLDKLNRRLEEIAR